jgi:hypothetical protein
MTACPTGTHIHHQEASSQNVTPGKDKVAQQVLASAVEVGELPAQEGNPGGRKGLTKSVCSLSPERQGRKDSPVCMA